MGSLLSEQGKEALAKARAKLSRKQKTVAQQLAKASRYGWHGCLINRGWQDQLLANMVMMRALPGGDVALVVVLVDLGCLGLKGVYAYPRLSGAALAEFLQEAIPEPEPCAPGLCVAIAELAVSYGARWGFMPSGDYFLASALWQRVDPEPYAKHVRCGDEQDRPVYIEGPDDDAEAILAQLKRTRGRDFVYVVEGKTRYL